MAKYNFVVLSGPTAGREAEYNDWYSTQHLRDVLAVPGFVSAQRFKLQDNNGGPAAGAMTHPYMAVYEVDTNDVGKSFAELLRRAGTPKMPLSEALDQKNVVTGLYGPITEKMSSSK